jgi:hypothetical protein
MKWLAVVALVSVVAIGVVLWINSGSTAHAPTTEPTSEPTPTPTSVLGVTSVDDAVLIAIGSSPAARSFVLLAKAMTAQEAADRTTDLGLGSFPEIAPADWQCPDGSNCPYPGESANEHGYLIIERLSGTPDASGSIHVTVRWISESLWNKVTAPDVVLSAAKWAPLTNLNLPQNRR